MKKLILIALMCLPLALSLPAAVFAVGPGGACHSDDDCDDQGNVQYGCYPEGNGVCTPWGDPTGGNMGGGGNNTGLGGPVGSNQPFVPLTDIPAFSNFNPSSGLPVALNSLYYICIGIAVVIAVLQLARAGITYMLADSITSKEEARHLIGASILGLVLVLSPYLVFHLINPSILSLNINVSNLAVNVNGSNGAFNTNGQSGLTQQQEDNGAKALYDTGFFDFLEFDGTDADAYKNATAYTCQTTGQTKVTPFNSGGHAPYYTTCVTPKFSYLMIAGGSYLNPDDQATETRFEQECNGLGDAQHGIGFDEYAPKQTFGTQQVDCGTGQKCFQDYTACNDVKP